MDIDIDIRFLPHVRARGEITHFRAGWKTAEMHSSSILGRTTKGTEALWTGQVEGYVTQACRISVALCRNSGSDCTAHA